jgi:hypothetical protein
MTADQIQKRLDAVPFRPFDLCLVDGRTLHVAHPELISFGSRTRVVILWTPDAKVEMIDTVLVVSLRFAEEDFWHEPRQESRKPEGEF